MAKVHITHAIPEFSYWYIFHYHHPNGDYIRSDRTASATIELPVGRYIAKASNTNSNWRAVKIFEAKDSNDVCVILEDGVIEEIRSSFI